jgi:DNA-binding NarL/FixJ family response regulator
MFKPRVIIADDHTLLAEAFEKLLAAECDIVGRAANGRVLLSIARVLRPDVVVLDIAMPLLNGLDAGRQLKQMNPAVRLVFVTMNEDPSLAAEAFRAGASAYLLKTSAGAELLTAIREVMNGRSYVTPLITDGLVGSFIKGFDRDKPYELSPRQREVLQLLAEGKSMKEAASILSIAPRTIAFHKYRMMEQLKIRSTAELIQFAMRRHIV